MCGCKNQEKRYFNYVIPRVFSLDEAKTNKQ